MKKSIPLSIMSLVAAFIFSAGLMAQEKTEVIIQVKKDGKVVKDTTYQFDDADEADHVVKMIEVMSGMDADMERIHYNYTMVHSGEKHANSMVFISKDGEKTEIKEIHGDTLVWITKGEGDGEHVKVMKYKMKEGEDPHMEHMHGKHVVVIKKGDGDENVIYISEDNDVKVLKIVEEEGEGENVKVIVIKKEIKEIDEDVDHDEDVEIEVVIKKQKKEKK
jgi:hypothetical protein